MLTHVAMILAGVALIGMIVAQDWLVPSLRNNTISAGLTGPLHWWLDGTYVLFAAALVLRFTDRPLMEALAVLAAVFLLLVASTNTFWRWWDAHTMGAHAVWHSRFTIAVFVTALLLQVAGDFITGGWRVGFTIGNVVLPLVLYTVLYVRHGWLAASPATEKLLVLMLVTWTACW